ncbi:hypothetical protein [Streptomyces vietnamensis]|uniref:hypothetical protein n=1 Tax=Streptomyces vietnamensis TaxID=362257 RepID=UPI00343EBDF5
MTTTSDDSASTAPAGTVSASERLLFGGELAYDQGWSQHNGTWVKLKFLVPPQILTTLKDVLLGKQALTPLLVRLETGDVRRMAMAVLDWPGRPQQASTTAASPWRATPRSPPPARRTSRAGPPVSGSRWWPCCPWSTTGATART